MSQSYIQQFIYAILRECSLHKSAVVVVFSIVSYVVLAVGLFWPETYESSGTIYADRQNIIQPLLQGQASITQVEDEARNVREVIYAPSFMRRMLEQTGQITASTDPVDAENQINFLRSRIVVEKLGGRYIQISYKDSNADRTFKIVNSAIDLFIKDSGINKRNESKEAYLFINKQVKNYKEQLKLAEDKLRQFNENNTDGTQAAISARIVNLRGTIEEMKLNVGESQQRIKELENQLNAESANVSQRFNTEILKQRLLDAQARLDSLRLLYTETYPDVVSLKAQIEELKQAVVDNENHTPNSSVMAADAGINPLYEDLRSRLSESRVTLQTEQRRLAANEGLLEQEYERSKRIAAGQAELSELTRDYDVTRNIYEDLLARKEKARISMTLDVEGRGVTYKIQEPAMYPLSAVGLRFLHFVLLGPALGLLVPIGVVIMYVRLDPRIRFIEDLESALKVPLLAVVPHMMTPINKRILKRDFVVLGIFVSVMLAGYCSAVAMRVMGML